MKILIPLQGLIDKEAETARLNREIEKLSKDLDRSEAKLKNPSFTDRAPTEVVQKEQTRAQEFQAAIEKLKHQLETLARI